MSGGSDSRFSASFCHDIGALLGLKIAVTLHCYSVVIKRGIKCCVIIIVVKLSTQQRGTALVHVVDIAVEHIVSLHFILSNRYECKTL